MWQYQAMPANPFLPFGILCSNSGASRYHHYTLLLLLLLLIYRQSGVERGRAIKYGLKSELFLAEKGREGGNKVEREACPPTGDKKKRILLQQKSQRPFAEYDKRKKTHNGYLAFLALVGTKFTASS